MLKIKQYHLHIQKELTTIYPLQEAEQIAYRLLETYAGVSKIDMALSPNAEVESTTVQTMDEAVKRLLLHEPLQYVIGEADFYDLTFKVTADVLIPRPETEELVQLILARHRGATPSILDIGTGSGCIPIALKKNMPDATVVACDISEGALVTAKGNAALNDADVHFFHCDILNASQWPKEKYDIIVSNPPYVLDSEKALMRANVLDFEPHLALFVADDQPLLFYRAIADFALVSLHHGGALYFEINEAFGLPTQVMLEEKGFNNVELHSDIFGKARMMSARL